MINLCEVSKTYHRRRILHHLDWNLPSRGLIALIGRSGSGKTTIFRMLKNLEKPDAGTIQYDGHQDDIMLLSQSSKWMNKIGVAQFISFFGDFPESDIHSALGFCRLEHCFTQEVTSLSGGEKKRLQIALAILLHKKVLLFDEPFSGLDEENITLVLAILKRLSETVLCIVATHQATDDASFDAIYQIEKGRLVCLREQELSNGPSSPSIATSSKRSLNHFGGYLFKSSQTPLRYLCVILSGFFLSLTILLSAFTSASREQVTLNLLQPSEPLYFSRYISSTSYLPDDWTLPETTTFPYISVFPSSSLNVDDFTYLGFYSRNEQTPLKANEMILSSLYQENYEIGDYYRFGQHDFQIVDFINVEDDLAIISRDHFADFSLSFQINVVQTSSKTPYRVSFSSTITDTILFPSIYDTNQLSALTLLHAQLDLPIEALTVKNLGINLQIGEFSDSQLVIADNLKEHFFFSFAQTTQVYYLPHNHHSALKRFMNEAQNRSLEVITNNSETVDRVLELQQQFQDLSIGLTAASAIFFLFFLYLGKHYLDRTIYEKELRFLEIESTYRQVRAWHILIHGFYSLVSLLLATLVIVIISALQHQTFYLTALFACFSSSAYIIIASVLVLALLLSITLHILSRYNRGYKYAQFLYKNGD